MKTIQNILSFCVGFGLFVLAIFPVGCGYLGVHSYYQNKFEEQRTKDLMARIHYLELEQPKAEEGR